METDTICQMVKGCKERMRYTSNKKTLEIHIIYESVHEWNNVAVQKKNILTIKALERYGLLKAQVLPKEQQIIIKTYSQQIFGHILKGLESVK